MVVQSLGPGVTFQLRCVILGKLPSLSGPQFPHLPNGVTISDGVVQESEF